MTPQNQAVCLLEELGINQLPIIPKDICHRLEIRYCEESLEGLDGILVLDPVNGSGVISVNRLIAEQGRKNFTGAHELGHWCMDGLEQTQFYCTRDMIESFKTTIQPIELRANEFAAELLMPRFIYQTLVNEREPGWNEIKELSMLSHTSLTSTALRFVALTDLACCLVVSKAGEMEWFRKSDEFRAYVQMNNRLLSQNTVAYTVFKGSKPPDRFEDVKADNWISGRGVKQHTEILEWSLPLNQYGRVLTILYDEEGIYGWDEDDLDEDDDIEWDPPTFHKSKRKG